MPGKKTLKSKKKGGNKSGQDENIRDIEFKQDMEEYGKVMRLLGDRKILIKLPDCSEIMGVIPGKFRKKNCKEKSTHQNGSSRRYLTKLITKVTMLSVRQSLTPLVAMVSFLPQLLSGS